MSNELEERYQQIVERLREREYRLTPQRQAILKALLEGRRHPTLDEVYARVKPTYPMTSLSTVYKTIEVLRDLGEVLELEFADGNRYDVWEPRDHPHLICTSCRRIDEVDLPEATRLVRSASTASGYRVLRQRLDFYGLCPDCQSTG